MSVSFKRKSFKDDFDSIVNTIYDEEYGRVQKHLANSFLLDLSLLYDLFGCEKMYKNDIIAELSINSVCPRYLETWSFDINYRKSIEEMILTCVHVIIHFVWFEKWSKLFKNVSKDEYNAPSETWLLSEIVIDAIIKETELKKYCSEDKPAYKHFYDIQIDGVNMMEHFRGLFNSGDINKFMIEGYRYVMENKQLLW